LEQVAATVVRGNRLKRHRLGAVDAGNKRYQRAPVIVHGASNIHRNRSFQPVVHDASQEKAAEVTRRLGSIFGINRVR
jgi:hypothetical protein